MVQCFFAQSFFASSLLVFWPGAEKSNKKDFDFKAGVRGGDRMKRGLWCLGRPVWLPVSGYLLAVQPSVAVWTLQKSNMISLSFAFWFCSAGLLGSKSDMPESLTVGPV